MATWGDKEVPWVRRQRTALTGMVPVAALVLGVPTGFWLADSVGMPYALGATVGGMAGLFASRAILRQVFGREST